MISRDTFGFEPVYYRDDGRWSRSFRELMSGIPLVIDKEALHGYLHHQYLVGNKTLIKGIYKLPPLSAWRHWNVKQDIGNDSVGELERIIEESVGAAVAQEEELGIFVSGGLDSSVIAAMAASHIKRAKLHAFSMAFDAFSEAKWAELVIGHLGMIPHAVLLTGEDVMRVLPDVIKDVDEPMGDAAGINRWVLARRASEYVKVVLSGDGGDEIFAGYPWHRLGMTLDALRWANKPAKLAASVIPYKGVLNSLCGFIYQRAGVFWAKDSQIYMESAMSDAEVKWLTGKCLSDGYVQFHRPEIEGRLNQMQTLDITNLLPEKFLVQGYGVFKNSGVIEKCPYINTEIVDYVLSLPENMRLRGNVGKYILRLVAAKYLPSEIVWRKKQGFGTPLVAWLNGALGKVAIDRLEDGDLIKDYFRTSSIKQITAVIRRKGIKRYHDANAIWTILALQLWWDSINGR